MKADANALKQELEAAEATAVEGEAELLQLRAALEEMQRQLWQRDEELRAAAQREAAARDELGAALARAEGAERSLAEARDAQAAAEARQAELTAALRGAKGALQFSEAEAAEARAALAACQAQLDVARQEAAAAGAALVRRRRLAPTVLWPASLAVGQGALAQLR